MVCLWIVLLFVSNYIVFFCEAQSSDELYECSVHGDSHVITWHPKSVRSLDYHSCYGNAFFEVVRNQFVYYKVQISKKHTMNIELFFYNGTSQQVICMVLSYHFSFDLDPEDKAQCRNHGITWELVTGATVNILAVTYSKANFSTNIRQVLQDSPNTHQYDLHVWQMKSLTVKSTGICQIVNESCLNESSRTDSELKPEDMWPERRSLTQNEAQFICKTRVDKFLSKSRKAPHQRSINTNNTISVIMEMCAKDLMLTGILELAKSNVDVLMTEELTAEMKSVNEIKAVIDNDKQQAVITDYEAVEEAKVETAQILELSTVLTKIISTTSTNRANAITTTTTTLPDSTSTTLSLGSLKCAIYEDMYIQTWHSIDQATPPSSSCLGTSSNFDVVRNPYVRFTIRTSGSVIDELTIVLFDGISTNAICTVSAIGQDADWMDCEEHGIHPNFINTTTHESLSFYYAKANFTTVITRDVGINIGRFNINIYLNPELAIKSTGICNLLSSCTGTEHAQSKKRLFGTKFN